MLDTDRANVRYPDDDHRSPRVRNRPFRKIIPFLAFAFIGLLIAREEIPAVRDAWERMLAPAAWQAKQTCLAAAYERAERRAFARLLKPGIANKTNDGFYVEKLVVGEMGRSGDEVPVEYTCYLDSAGKLVRLNRVE